MTAPTQEELREAIHTACKVMEAYTAAVDADVRPGEVGAALTVLAAHLDSGLTESERTKAKTQDSLEAIVEEMRTLGNKADHWAYQRIGWARRILGWANRLDALAPIAEGK